MLTSIALSLSLAPSAKAQESEHKPEPPKIIRKSGGVLQGSATRRVEPVYPPLAKAARISGSVVIEVTADEEGNVISARAISGHPLLKDAAVSAAKRWRFTPTILSGVPVKVIGTLTFNFNLGDYYNEIEDLKAQIAVDPNSAELYYKLGLAYYFDGDNNKAKESYTEAIRLKPDYADAYYQMGCLYNRFGTFELAIEALQKSLSLNRGDADVYLELSEVYFKTNRVDDELEAARQVLIRNPDFHQSDRSYPLIGLVLTKQGRYGEAIQALKEGARLGPNQAHFHLYLGMTYDAAGDRDSAMREYEYLKEKSPEIAQRLLNVLNKKQ